MPDEYYPIAEEEYATAVEKYMDEHCLDRSVYKCSTDYVALKKRGVVPCMGQRVRLESDRFFASGYRESRITVVDQKLERPTEADIEISDVLSQTTQSRMANEIENVRSEVKANTVELPDVIRSWDTTLPTDNNLFSARRSEQEFLSRKRNDRTKGRITFEQGVVFGEEENGFVDGKGNAELLTAVVKELLSSGDYSGGGLTDRGWKLGMDEDRLSHLIVDKLTVRQVMNVFELLINKVRSVGGQICVSAANGKIKAVEDKGNYWKIVFEQENTFVAHDLMRCQVFTRGEEKGYWVEVAEESNGGVLVAKAEFEGSEPSAGDECVLMGNTQVENRQNLVLISASEDGHPRVDVLDGVSGKSFEKALRARLGCLDGIKDDSFPLENQPHGNGLYADNVFLRGTFLLSNGEDVKTRFEVTEGMVQSAIDGVRNDFVSDKGYLNNATFRSGLEMWDSDNETVFFLVGNRWVWANDNVLSKKGDGASVVTDMGRTVVRIKNKYILQKHGNLRYVPSFASVNDGKKEALPVYLSFFYRCAKGGTLKVSFEGVDKAGFENFNSMDVTEALGVTEGYVQYTCNGLWNGTGDFKLEFDGDIYLYMLVLSTDKVESLTYKYKTLFEQSERLVKISAAVFDKDEKMLEETGLITTSKVSGLYAIDGDGNLKSFIGAGQDGVKIKAANIQLEGIVTANENFKILADGSIEAKNGKFIGEIESNKGIIGGFTIGAGRIGAEATQSGDGGSLAIYSNFFRVGGDNGYVMFGNDVIPGTAGGAFTATGRIVNEHPNTYGNYGLDQANYGLFIHVSGGTKNYGIWSNAALMAPSFVNTKAKILTFDPNATSYSVDFSQANVILMYFKKDKSSGVEVTLPSESSVAEKFGLTELPEDFATVVTFRVRAGSLPITLKGIYDHNENLTNYQMAEGDSVTVLISKVDGFRYQILNHSK